MTELEPARTQVVFATRSGPLTVTRKGTLYEMDFPSRPLAPTSRPIEEVARALGATPSSILEGQSVVAIFDHAAAVRALRPDIAAIAAMDTHALSVTAPGTDSDGDVDFVSRFFAPRVGVDEDPVTGSAHCSLGPYWGAKLGKTDLVAWQASRRGGEVRIRLAGPRLVLGGRAITVMRGELV